MISLWAWTTRSFPRTLVEIGTRFSHFFPFSVSASPLSRTLKPGIFSTLEVLQPFKVNPDRQTHLSRHILDALTTFSSHVILICLPDAAAFSENRTGQDLPGFVTKETVRCRKQPKVPSLFPALSLSLSLSLFSYSCLLPCKSSFFQERRPQQDMKKTKSSAFPLFTLLSSSLLL